MYSSAWPDWSRIGRRIGKRLRDIIQPPRDTGPSPEERRAQRLRDVRRGFAYLDTFDELIEWSPNEIDPVQRANTPLLPRSRNHVHDCRNPSTKLLLCHDYNGGYHDYESVRPSLQAEEQYSCEHLQYVEIFVYFSHKLVCCPPPTWTNLMHRNGVKILGSFIVEPQTINIERMLENQGGQYVVAAQLAALANNLGFDGWLLNVEQEFPEDIDIRGKLVGFIVALKQCLGPAGLVIWYDALTVENEVRYQNGLTAMNEEFARHADALFTNYKWTLEKLFDSRLLAREVEMEASNIFFGIDVWAQNTNMPGPRRITYPANGGGGTNTGLATHVLAKERYSTAIFAPAWSYEHFPTSVTASTDPLQGVGSIAKAVDRSIWEGFPLPEHLCCDCRQGRPHHHGDYQNTPIVASACEFPAGSSCYLHTDFTQAFKKDTGSLRSCLGSQSILPHLLPISAPDWESRAGYSGGLLYGQLEDGVLSVRARIAKRVDSHADMEAQAEPRCRLSGLTLRRLGLFKVDMDGQRELHVSITYSSVARTEPCTVGFYTGYQVKNTQQLEYGYQEIPQSKLSDALDAETRDCKTTKLFQLRPRPSTRLVEVGVFCEDMNDIEDQYEMLRLRSLKVQPPNDVGLDITIEDMRMTQRGEGPDAEVRLTWSWDQRGFSEQWPDWLPRSPVTGPFSHFTVTIGGKKAGSAYGFEFPIVDEDCGDLQQVEVLLVGHLFGGGEVHGRKVVKVLKIKQQPNVGVRYGGTS